MNPSLTQSLRQRLWRALGEASIRKTDDRRPYLDRLLEALARNGLEVRDVK